MNDKPITKLPQDLLHVVDALHAVMQSHGLTHLAVHPRGSLNQNTTLSFSTQRVVDARRDGKRTFVLRAIGRKTFDVHLRGDSTPECKADQARMAIERIKREAGL